MVTRQVVNLFESRFDDSSVEYTERWILITFDSQKFSKRFKWDERRFALIAIGIEVIETDFP